MGTFSIVEVVLLAIVTFIFAIDQFSLTELIYRPMIACPIIGLILGSPETGLVVGGTYELMMVGNMPIGGAQPPNAVLGGIVAMVFAVKANRPGSGCLHDLRYIRSVHCNFGLHIRIYAEREG